MNLRRMLLLALVLVGLITATAHPKEPIRLAGAPALSPDGKLLAFDWNGDIWTVASGGGAARQLTTDPGRDSRPRFSPDGKTIAFVSDRDGTSQVYIVPVTGGTPKQLTYHSSGSSVQEWSADGKELLISAVRDHHWRHGERFFRIPSTERGTEQILFDDYGRDGTLSPDGKKLLFTREGEQWFRKGYYGSQASQIWLYDLDKKEFKQLIAESRSARTPLWRPDGKAFYYVGGDKNDSTLAEYDLATNKSQELYRAKDELIVMPALARDGSTLVFRQLFDFYTLKLGDKAEVKKIDIERVADARSERKERRTLTSAAQAAFTNDALEIAVVSGGDVWVMDTELREPRQVTSSAGEERNPLFSADGETLYFLSEAAGKTDIFKAERADKSKFWWQNRQFKVTRVTEEGDLISGPRFTPDGKLSFQRNRGDIWVADSDGKNARKLLQSWSSPEYDFSPDGKWLVYAENDDDHNRDVWLKALDGESKPYNLSRHPNNEFQPVWSPDGRYLAYRGGRPSRDGDYIVSLVYLRAEDVEKTGRDRTLEKALDKMNKGRKPGAKPLGAEDKPATKGGPVVIDMDGLQDRIRRISLGSTGSASTLFWSPDSKKLAFTGSVNGTAGTYTVDVAEESLTPRSLTSGVGLDPRWLRQGNQIVWVAAGSPSVLPGSGVAAATPATPTNPLTGRTFPSRSGGATPSSSTDGSTGTPYRFSVMQEVDLGQKHAAAFDQCWRLMRDNWYDDRLGNKDWAKIRTKYSAMAAEAVDSETFALVVNLMLGELNGSHLGFTGLGSSTGRGRGPATDPLITPPTQGTAHLGVRFDAAFAGPGLKVRDVLPTSPAEQKRSHLVPGDIVLSINGQEVGPKTDLTVVLNGPMQRELELKVKGKDGKERDVLLQPISYTAARGLLYEKWLRDNREMVDKLSNGRLGYLHISAMSMPSFQKFEEELYSIGAGKDGLVIDVRENGGGSTADHLLTSLTQPVHAIAVPRGGGQGYPQDRKVYGTWNKPIVVLCNQNSFSNAEIFSHAIKTLKRGKLVGVRTAGGVISTGAASIMDVGILRMPTRGWFLVNDGEDMELNGAAPDVALWPAPGDLPRGKDVQLSKGVEVLLADVELWKQRPKPTLKKATERKDDGISSRRD